MYARLHAVLCEVTDRNVLGWADWTAFFFLAFLSVLCIRSQHRAFATDDIAHILALFHRAAEVAALQCRTEGRVMSRLLLTQFVFDMFVRTDAATLRLQ